ncbi:glycosyltransferase family 2 protein [Maridesulfovibrio sp. FT414]|uniref:glycosyltransferase family 2 protein n=1 Tax=Maridesulfovibrio sp. FT414 TaxID=2979469 RepID=UPI003D8079A9
MCLLSIIIPNYNYGRFSDRFFSSIQGQTMSLDDVQILFVDDGSSDDSLEQAGKWSGLIRCAGFEIFTPGRSGRPGPVRNFGLERAAGEYLVCLDPDDTFSPQFFEMSLGVLQSEQSVDLVYTDYQERGPGGCREVRLPDFKPLYLRNQNPVPPAAVFRRRLWEAGVRYRDNTSYEDWDFWIQCLMAGARFRHLAEILYTYEIHGSNFSRQAEEDDGPSKARIVLNNPGFFHDSVFQWARDHLRGRDYAPAFSRGYIPTADDIEKVMALFRNK